MSTDKIINQGTSEGDKITYYKNAKVRKDSTGRILEESFDNGIESRTVSYEPEGREFVIHEIRKNGVLVEDVNIQDGYQRRLDLMLKLKSTMQSQERLQNLFGKKWPFGKTLSAREAKEQEAKKMLSNPRCHKGVTRIPLQNGQNL